MRRFFLASAILSLAVFLVLVLPTRTIVVIAKGGQAGGVAIRNGDMNGDSKVNLSDVIYLVHWLYDGGPEPVACAQAPAAATRQWPPRPQDIVNLDGQASLKQGDSESIFQVPQDKWFIVTEFSSIGRRVGLLESLGADQRVKRGDFFTGAFGWTSTVGQGADQRIVYPATLPTGGPYTSTVGLAFRPGSQVVLKGLPMDPITYTLTGYLADP